MGQGTSVYMHLYVICTYIFGAGPLLLDFPAAFFAIIAYFFLLIFSLGEVGLLFFP